MLYARTAASFDACKEAARAVLDRKHDWKSLANILRKSGKTYGVSETATERLELLEAGKAVAVVTGQQTGFLGGPMFTLLKAYHTTRLAKELEAELDLAVLPIFWLEGEDHDLAEVCEAKFLSGSGEIFGSKFEPSNFEQGKYVGLYQADARQHLTEIADKMGNPHEQGLSLLNEAYAGSTLSEGLGRLLAKTLGSKGLLIVEGMEDELKKLALPLWKKVLDEGHHLSELFQSRAEELLKANWPTPMSPTKEAYLFYLAEADRRRSVVNYNGTLRTSDNEIKKLSLEDLRKVVEAHPEYVSPKAALRPLYQDFVLPTIAYVAGPGELEYHAQLAPFYKLFDLPAPSLFPRLSATFLDGKSARNLEKLNLSLEKLLREDSVFLAKALIQEQDSHHTAELFANSKQAMEMIYARLKSALHEIDPTLEGACETSAGKSIQPLEQLHQKADKALKQQHATMLSRLEKLLTVAKPNGKPAERIYSVGYYLLKYGPDELLRILDSLPSDGKEHQIIIES